MRKRKQKEVFNDIFAYNFPKNYWWAEKNIWIWSKIPSVSQILYFLVPDCEPSRFIAFQKLYLSRVSSKASEHCLFSAQSASLPACHWTDLTMFLAKLRGCSDGLLAVGQKEEASHSGGWSCHIPWQNTGRDGRALESHECGVRYTGCLFIQVGWEVCLEPLKSDLCLCCR